MLLRRFRISVVFELKFESHKESEEEKYNFFNVFVSMIVQGLNTLIHVCIPFLNAVLTAAFWYLHFLCCRSWKLI